MMVLIEHATYDDNISSLWHNMTGVIDTKENTAECRYNTVQYSKTLH